MSASYLQMFTCTKCGRMFIKRVGGFVLTLEDAELRTRPVCDSCKMEQAVSGTKKGINALKKIVQRKH